MSFKSLVNKLVKEGKSREAATKIAGKVANAKMKGAGSGPTAKQKARMKGSPAKNTGGGRKKVSIDNKETATMKRKSFRRADGSAKLKQKQVTDDGTIRKTRKIEKRKAEGKGRRINKTVKIKSKDGVEVRKTKARMTGDGSTVEKTSYYRPKGSLKKKAKQRTTTTNVKDKSTPVKMKKQGYNARLDDSLGAKHGKKKQSLKSRRDESEGMEKSMKRKKFSGNKSSGQERAQIPDSKKKYIKPRPKKVTKVPGSDIDDKIKQSGKKKGSPAKMKGNPKKVERLKKKRDKQLEKYHKVENPKRATRINNRAYKTNEKYKAEKEKLRIQPPESKKRFKKDESPAKRFQAYDQMDTRNAVQTAGSPMGMYGKHSPANMSGQSYDAKEAYNKNLSASARLQYLENNRADAKAKKGGHSIHKHMGGRR